MNGWAWRANMQKPHYFVAGRSLCGKWGLIGGETDGEQPYPEHEACKPCFRGWTKRAGDRGKESK